MKKALFLAVLLFAVGQKADAVVLEDFLLTPPLPDATSSVASVAGNATSDTMRGMPITVLGGETDLTLTIDLAYEGSSPPTGDLEIVLFNGGASPTTAVAGWSLATITIADLQTWPTFTRLDRGLSGSALTAGSYWLVGRNTVAEFSPTIYYIAENDIDFVITPAKNFNPTLMTWQGLQPPFSMKVTDVPLAPPTTPNEITTPIDTATVTDRPFTATGTCDAGANIFMRLEIFHPSSDTIIENTTTLCSLDAWTITGLGSTLWNDDYELRLLDVGATPLIQDIHDITIDITDNPVAPPPTVSQDIGCDTGQVIPDALCTVLTWLFIPNSDAVEKFSDLFDKVKLKPPIGYVTAGFVLWDSFAIGTSPDTLDGTNDLSAYFDPMKAVVTALLWVLFLVWIIRRVGTMNI